MLSVQHNMLAWNAERQFNINTKAKNKKAEKLSSGYRINRAADDAAGLAISEKMRRQIRGFHAGTENAEMGISWVQIGEGALNEAHDILHRMNELTIKSQNGTNTATDRAFMQAEFDQLQSELDRISETTLFNDQNIFREHEPVYHQITGNIQWDDMEQHEVLAGKNQLVIAYRDSLDGEQKEITLEVDPGTYTTHELIDELDDAATKLDSPIHLEFTEKGICRVNLEGGEIIDTITGGLTYLLFENYDGGGYGALIGTTEFTERPLKITNGKNDYMEFEIEYFDGSPTDTIKIDLLDDTKYAQGAEVMLSKEEIMDIIDKAVPASSGLKTSHHGKSIMLSSDLGIVTGFKGNMFTLETSNPIFTSVFYDNIHQGYVKQDPAFVVGGAVLTTDTRDKEHNRYYIDSTNNTLVLQPNLMETPTTITIDTNTTDGYDASQMVDELNKQFAAAGIDGEVRAYLVRSNKRVNFTDGTDHSSGGVVAESVGDASVVFEGVEIRTVKQGPDAIVNIDKDASTAYDTLFTIKNFNSYGADATISNETKEDKNAYAESAKDYSGGKTVKIKNGVNDQFTLILKSTSNTNTTSASDYSRSFVIDILDSGSKNMTAQNIVDEINKDINANSELKGRVIAEVTTDNEIRIRDVDNNSDKVLDNVNDSYLNWNTSIELGNAGNNSGYRTIFQKEYQYDEVRTVSGKGTLTISNVPTNLTGSKMSIYINGVKTDFNISGKTNASGVASAINTANPIMFTSVSDSGASGSRNVSMSGNGQTTVTDWGGGSAPGKAVPVQGTTDLSANVPAELAIGPCLKSSMTVDSTNDKITLSINGDKRTLTLAHGTFNPDQLAAKLQEAINNDAVFKNGWGATVDVDNNDRLVITSVLPPAASGKDGSNTSIQSYGKGTETNTFFESLNTVKTAASAKSNIWVSNSITLQEGVNDKFHFSYTDSTGTHNNVEIDLSDSAAGETIDRDEFLTRLKNGLTAGGYQVNAAITDNYLVLSTQETGTGKSVSYYGASTDANADAIFGGLSNPTAARVVLDKNVKTSASFTGQKTFSFMVDGQKKDVKIGAWSSANDLVGKLNTAFANYKKADGTADPINVTASIVNGRLCLTNGNKGSGTSLSVSYDNSSGSVMKDMFGTEPAPNIKVSASGNTLTIKAGANDVISVRSDTSGGVVKPTKATAYLPHESKAGFHSAKYSTVTSVALNPNGIVIDRWNKDFQFTFYDGTKTSNQSTKVEIELEESTGGTPTSLTAIRDDLQAKINAKLGSDAIEVSLDSGNHLVLKSKKPGSQFTFSGMQSNSSGKTGGGFYHHVMCAYTLKENQLDDPEDVNGEQFMPDIFAQGRHDVVGELTKLKPGVSDTLILDLNFTRDDNENGRVDGNEKEETITLTMKLDPNMREEDFYNSTQLKKMIQEKLDEVIESTDVQKQAHDLGLELHKGLIEVDIGRHKTDVVGNKDSVAISFTLTKDPDLATPVEGFFYIDGIRGNAAYETFYHTEGELIPAYIIGTKDLNKGVDLGPDDTELTFFVDDVEYTVELEGNRHYTAEELVDDITQKFEDQNIPLAAEITKKGVLKISHKRMGLHTIEKVQGSARDNLFFLEDAQRDPFQERYIRISSNEGDRIELFSPRFSTTMLNINSICISDVKYAEKATDRIKAAITTVSELRNTFGALQNRLEHTINNNRNKEENTQAAESRIRDADIATEMVAFSNLSIIQQAGQAVLAQANQSRQGLLSLLG